MPYLTVKRQKHGTFEVDVDGHSFVVEDRPDGTGHGAGPTPVELMVAGLASTVAATVDTYLAHDSYPAAGLHVTARYAVSTAQPDRVSSIDLTVNLPELAADRLGEIQGLIGQCIAGVTMPRPPDVGVVLVAGEAGSTATR
jgi:putative redox protein